MATTAAPAPPADLTTGVMALRVGVLVHHLRLLAERGLVPARRCGKFWAFNPADAPANRAAAEAAGFIQMGA